MASPAERRGEDELAGLRAEIERLRSTLEQRDKLIAMLQDAAEEFVGSVAHDVKNPVAAIKLTVQSLRRSLQQQQELAADHWDARLTQVEHSLDQLLERVATLRARASAGLAPVETARPEPCDLVRLLHEAVDLYKQAAKRHTIRLRCPEAVLVGRWDERLLRRTVDELLDNAIKFSPPGGQIGLTLERQSAPDTAWAVMRVQNAGMGIPSRDLAHVFERFYRGENVVGRVKGAGLGLFQALRDVEQHGGSIVVDSREGEGAQFTVRLPLI